MASTDIIVNTSNSKYAVVRDAISSKGWKLITDKEDESEFVIYWQDGYLSSNRVTSLAAYQRVNHWPGMFCLHRKDGLARTLGRMIKVFPGDFDFVPRTWVLPDFWADFCAQFTETVTTASGVPVGKKSKHTFIVKPAASCQGRGIFLTRRLEDVDPRTQQVAQRYITRPFLVDGFKFDMRIYVYVSSVDPLRVWLFDEGLCRFATTPYHVPSSSNMSVMTCHLTNYAINKNSGNFVFNTGGVDAGDTGSKRTLSWFRRWLDENGYSSQLVWGRIGDMINKALLAAQPHLARSYRVAVGSEERGVSGTALGACTVRAFEVLGLDVMLDHRLRPWLIEVNHSPSFTCDTPLDYDIKFKLISETLDMLRIRTRDKKKAQELAAATAKSRLLGGGGGGSGGASKSAPSTPARPGSAKVTPSAASGGSLPAGLRSPGAAGSKRARPASATSPGGPASAGAAPAEEELSPYEYPNIPLKHIKHEIKTAKGYSLIYPPPDPTAVAESIFRENAAAKASMDKALAALALEYKKKAKKDKGKGGRGGGAGEEDAAAASAAAAAAAAAVAEGGAAAGGSDSDSESGGEDAAAAAAAASAPAAALAPDSAAAGAEGEDAAGAWRPPVVDGVPRPCLRPYDASREDLVARIRSYDLIVAVAAELYGIESRAEAGAGRRIGVECMSESAAAMAEALRKGCGLPAAAAATSSSGAAASAGGALPPPVAAAATDAARFVSAERVVRALAKTQPEFQGLVKRLQAISAASQVKRQREKEAAALGLPPPPAPPIPSAAPPPASAAAQAGATKGSDGALPPRPGAASARPRATSASAGGGVRAAGGAAATAGSVAPSSGGASSASDAETGYDPAVPRVARLAAARVAVADAASARHLSELARVGRITPREASLALAMGGASAFEEHTLPPSAAAAQFYAFSDDYSSAGGGGSAYNSSGASSRGGSATHARAAAPTAGFPAPPITTSSGMIPYAYPLEASPLLPSSGALPPASREGRRPSPSPDGRFLLPLAPGGVSGLAAALGVGPSTGSSSSRIGGAASMAETARGGLTRSRSAGPSQFSVVGLKAAVGASGGPLTAGGGPGLRRTSSSRGSSQGSGGDDDAANPWARRTIAPGYTTLAAGAAGMSFGAPMLQLPGARAGTTGGVGPSSLILGPVPSPLPSPSAFAPAPATSSAMRAARRADGAILPSVLTGVSSGGPGFGAGRMGTAAAASSGGSPRGGPGYVPEPQILISEAQRHTWAMEGSGEGPSPYATGRPAYGATASPATLLEAWGTRTGIAAGGRRGSSASAAARNRQHNTQSQLWGTSFQ